MKKILIAGCSQEVSSFNPVTCDNNFFNISTGNEIYKFNKGLNTYIGGVIEDCWVIFDKDDGIRRLREIFTCPINSLLKISIIDGNTVVVD